jgi:hypothetical protein
MERAKGFEPSTPTLARLCSTPELRPRISCGVFVAWYVCSEYVCRISTWLPGIHVPGPRSVPLRPYGSQLRSLLRSPRFQPLVRGLRIRVSWQSPADAEYLAYGNRITVNDGNIFNRFFSNYRICSAAGGPGGDLLSHVLRRSTIGAEGFHGRVRDGIGCGPLAMTTRSASRGKQMRLSRISFSDRRTERDALVLLV